MRASNSILIESVEIGVWLYVWKVQNTQREREKDIQTFIQS